MTSSTEVSIAFKQENTNAGLKHFKHIKKKLF